MSKAKNEHWKLNIENFQKKSKSFTKTIDNMKKICYNEVTKWKQVKKNKGGNLHDKQGIY